MKPNESNWKPLTLSLVILALIMAALWGMQTKTNMDLLSSTSPNLIKAPTEPIKPKLRSKEEPSLKDLFRRSIENVSFKFPVSDEVEAFESVLSHSIANSFRSDDLSQKWNALGWNLCFVNDGGIVVIEEQATQRRGRGLYALRIQQTDPIMIQSPHRFYDTDTGVISRKLFEDNPIQAAAWNTVHRNQYDMAHRSRSFFNAFTRCVLQRYPDVVNFQIHGFASSKRKGDNAESPQTLAIISNATRSPDHMTKLFARQMKSSFGRDRIWLFPLETKELGATTNEQASVMRQQGSGRFLHVEMTRAFRTQLMKSARDRQTIYQAFATATRTSGDLAKTDKRAKGRTEKFSSF